MIPIVISSILFIILAFMTKGFAGIYSILLIFVSALVILAAIKIIVKDSIISVLYLILMLIIGSIIPPEFQIIFTYLVLVSSILLILFSWNLFKDLISLSYEKIIKISWLNIGAWFLIFSYILFLGGYDVNGFNVNDPIHAPYSLSIGQSYAASFFNTPDLSYVGKELRYNFLFEQVPFFLANILGTSPLSVIYFELMFLLTIFTFVIINSFTFRNYSIPIPIFILFFLPTYNLLMLSGESIFERTLNFTPSYFVAFILVVISIHLLVNKRHLLLIVASTVLFNIKAMYLVTLMGGIFLFLLRKRNYKILLLFSIVAITSFSLLYHLFLSGSAEQALWLIFPQIIYERIPTIFSGQTIEIDPQRWVSLFVPLIFLYSSLFIYLNKDSDDRLLILSSISLSGLLGMFFVTELVTLSSKHFYNAAAFPMVLIFYYWLKIYYLPFRSSTLKSLLPVWLYTYWAFILLMYLVGVQKNDIKIISIIFAIFVFLGTVFALKKSTYNIKKLAEYSIWVVVAITMVQKTDNYLIKDFTQGLIDRTEAKSLIIAPNNQYNSFSNDFLIGYSWLNKNIDDGEVVLTGKHYESDIVFIKSALSGKQFYSEGSGTKGLGFQGDYSLRFANAIYFYNKFVDSSASSAESLKIYEDLNYKFLGGALYNNSLEDEQHKSLRAKALYIVSLGRGWSWINLPSKINDEIKAYLIKYNQMDENEANLWLNEFLESQEIKYVVLENNDKPKKYLKNYTDVIYENRSIVILSIKR
jgi:hypothetical protein